jgi:hypothetical protein
LAHALEEADIAVFGTGRRYALQCQINHVIRTHERHRGFILPKSRKPFNLEFSPSLP